MQGWRSVGAPFEDGARTIAGTGLGSRLSLRLSLRTGKVDLCGSRNRLNDKRSEVMAEERHVRKCVRADAHRIQAVEWVEEKVLRGFRKHRRHHSATRASCGVVPESARFHMQHSQRAEIGMGRAAGSGRQAFGRVDETGSNQIGTAPASAVMPPSWLMSCTLRRRPSTGQIQQKQE